MSPPEPRDSANDVGTSDAQPLPDAGGAHGGLLAARDSLERGRAAQAKEDLEAARDQCKRGLKQLGDGYAAKDVNDDTGLKLAAADDLWGRGEHANAVETCLRMLDDRLELYVRSHPGAPPEPRALGLTLAVPDSTGPGSAATVELTLSNVGTAPLIVNSRLAINSVHAPEPYHEVIFEVDGPDGKRRDFQTKINIGEPKPDQARDLAPNEKISRNYDLAKYFDLSQPGTYRVRGYYASAPLADAKGRPVWWQRVSSGEVSLQRK